MRACILSPTVPALTAFRACAAHVGMDPAATVAAVTRSGQLLNRFQWRSNMHIYVMLCHHAIPARLCTRVVPPIASGMPHSQTRLLS